MNLNTSIAAHLRTLTKEPSSTSTYPVISLFTGAGGLDIGLETAGFEVAVAIENDYDCIGTIQKNSDWPISDTTDITNIQPEELLRQADLKCREAALVAGGPPCQPFSKSGFWVNGDSKRLDDTRAKTIEHYFRIVDAALPQVILFENVRGIGFRGKNEALKMIEAKLQRINETKKTKYVPMFFNVNAASYGVPQTRERLFMVASREGMHFSLPDETHSPLVPHTALPSGLSPHTTAWDAIGSLDSIRHGPELSMRGKWSDLLPTIPEGQNYLWHTQRGGGVPLFGWRTRYWSFLLKLQKKRPSWTLQASPGPATGPFHWRNRLLSTREMARIQTFPDSHTFAGNYSSVRRQIGNAVPPAIGELFGRCIMNQLFGQALELSLTLIPKASENTPQAHRKACVPAKYKNAASNPHAHPGPGRGPRARNQRM